MNRVLLPSSASLVLNVSFHVIPHQYNMVHPTTNQIFPYLGDLDTFEEKNEDFFQNPMKNPMLNNMKNQIKN